MVLQYKLDNSILVFLDALQIPSQKKKAYTYYSIFQKTISS